MLTKTHPELVKQWHPANHLRPSDVVSGSARRVRWVCDLNHEWVTAIRERALRKTQCPFCTNRKVLPGFNDLATVNPHLANEWGPYNTLGPELYAPVSGKKVWWKCTRGHEWQAKIANRVNGRGCPECLVWSSRLSETCPDIYALAKDKGSVTGTTKTSKKRVEWECKKGHIWIRAVRDQVRDNRCPECFKKENFEQIDKINVTHPEVYSLAKDWALAATLPHNSSVELTWQCANNHTWTNTVLSQVSNNICPKCVNRYLRPGKTISEKLSSSRFEKLKSEWSDRNELAIEYYSYGSEYHAFWKCGEGHEWKANISNRVKGNDCARCSCVHTSRAEQGLAAFVSTLADIEANTRKIITPKELDIYIPGQKIAIEFNGLYWHTESKVGKDRHYDKWKACHDKGIQLITVWEDDWRLRRSVVENMLEAKIVGRKPIGARKTRVDNISYHQASDFLNRWHIQGASRGSSYIGLFYAGELVAVTVLSTNKSTCYLNRYASSVAIAGGLMKTLRHSGHKEFITFADREVSDGSLYVKSGWKHVADLAPDYKYLYQDTRVHKFAFRKQRFEVDPELSFDASMSERQLAELNGIPRIYDSGKAKYSLRFDT